MLFHGKISFISPALDPTTRTLQARIVVDNKGEKLKKDMYCTVSVTAGEIQNAIAVPDAAILRDDENEPFVYVLNGSNQFGRRHVKIGLGAKRQDSGDERTVARRQSCRRRQLVPAVCEFISALAGSRAQENASGDLSMIYREFSNT